MEKLKLYRFAGRRFDHPAGSARAYVLAGSANAALETYLSRYGADTPIDMQDVTGDEDHDFALIVSDELSSALPKLEPAQ